MWDVGFRPHLVAPFLLEIDGCLRVARLDLRLKAHNSVRNHTSHAESTVVANEHVGRSIARGGTTQHQIERVCV